MVDSEIRFESELCSNLNGFIETFQTSGKRFVTHPNEKFYGRRDSHLECFTRSHFCLEFIFNTIVNFHKRSCSRTSISSSGLLNFTVYRYPGSSPSIMPEWGKYWVSYIFVKLNPYSNVWSNYSKEYLKTSFEFRKKRKIMFKQQRRCGKRYNRIGPLKQTRWAFFLIFAKLMIL